MTEPDAVEDLPPLPVPDIDLDALGALLLKVESHAHRSGWDRPVHFRIVYAHDVDDGESDRMFRRITPPEHDHAPVRHGPYTATTIFGPRILYSIPGVPVWEQLRGMVLGIAYPLPPSRQDLASNDEIRKNLVGYTQMLRNMMRLPGVVAFSVTGEAWHNTGGGNLERAAAGEVNLGDLPDSKEVRIIYCVDLADRAHHVQRIRGQKPTLALDVVMRGDFTTSMRILADMATGRTPPKEQFGERYPTLIEAMKRWQSGAGRATEMRPAPISEAGPGAI